MFQNVLFFWRGGRCICMDYQIAVFGIKFFYVPGWASGSEICLPKVILYLPLNKVFYFLAQVNCHVKGWVSNFNTFMVLTELPQYYQVLKNVRYRTLVLNDQRS